MPYALDYITFWITISIIIGLIAQSKGSDFFVWFAFGILLMPAALLVILIRVASEAPNAASQRFNCPECGESIPVAAKSCRFCNRILSNTDKPKASTPQRAADPLVLGLIPETKKK